MSSPLDTIAIAAPCSANWNEMAGDDRKRACSLCKKDVYNISAMSRTEAEQLIRSTEGEICIRLYKRNDGTVIVDNCPVGLRAIRKRLQWVASGVAAIMATLGAFAAFNPDESDSGGSCRASGNSALKQWLFPAKTRTHIIMGALAAPTVVSENKQSTPAQ